MSKYVAILENLYINTDQIVTYEVETESRLIIATTAHSHTGSCLFIIEYHESMNIGKEKDYTIYVENEELQRIKREIEKKLDISQTNFEATAW